MKIFRILLILVLCSWVTGCYPRYSVGCLTVSPHVQQYDSRKIETVVEGALLKQGYEKTQVDYLDVNGGVEIITFSRTEGLSKELPSKISVKYQQEIREIYISFFDVYREVETEEAKELRSQIEITIKSNWPNANIKYDWWIGRRQFLDP